MKVHELIVELQKANPNDDVVMFVKPGTFIVDINWVEIRHPGGLVCLNDKYFTPYSEMDERGEN